MSDLWNVLGIIACIIGPYALVLRLFKEPIKELGRRWKVAEGQSCERLDTIEIQVAALEGKVQVIERQVSAMQRSIGEGRTC